MGRGANKKESGVYPLSRPGPLRSKTQLNPRELLLGQGSRGMKLKGILSDEEGRVVQDNKEARRKLEAERPTEIDSDGNKFWKNTSGSLHRDGDLPAIIESDGTKFWYQNGDPHRDGDQPAEIWADGTRRWYQDGKQHRDGDKPAAIRVDGTEEFWLEGQFIKRKKNSQSS